jgi:hypothetical protein
MCLVKTQIERKTAERLHLLPCFQSIIYKTKRALVIQSPNNCIYEVLVSIVSNQSEVRRGEWRFSKAQRGFDVLSSLLHPLPS